MAAKPPIVTIANTSFTLASNTLRADRARRVLLRKLVNYIETHPFKSVREKDAFIETNDPFYVDIMGCVIAIDEDPEHPYIDQFQADPGAWDAWLEEREDENTEAELIRAALVARDLNIQWYGPQIPLSQAAIDIATQAIDSQDPTDPYPPEKPDSQDLRETIEAAIEGVKNKDFLDQKK